MPPTVKQIAFVGAAALGVAVLIGATWYAGYSAGIQNAIQSAFYCEKLHADRHLSALKNLKDSRLEDARSNLETGLNLSVVLMTGSQRTPLMDEMTKRDIEESLRDIRAYRRTNPWAGYDDDVRRRVHEALENIPDAPSRKVP